MSGRGALSHFKKDGTPKMGYESRRDIRARIRTLARKTGFRLSDFQIYRCPTCDQLHFGQNGWSGDE